MLKKKKRVELREGASRAIFYAFFTGKISVRGEANSQFTIRITYYTIGIVYDVYILRTNKNFETFLKNNRSNYFLLFFKESNKAVFFHHFLPRRLKQLEYAHIFIRFFTSIEVLR